jgi:UDP-2-acetamido-2,6-beta-L-arabino-hexul-4-ose reductase
VEKMKILVTGAKGFVGKNLCASLKNIQDGKDKRFPELKIDAIFEYDLGNTPEELDAWCRECDFVFNLAGVNRPQNQEEFMQGNFGFASTLLDTLKKHNNRCPVMLSSSQQASLTGRFGNSEYGRSKKAGEELFLDYERDFLKAPRHSGLDPESHEIADQVRDDGLRSRVLIYRFPNLFGKWCRPNYNSAVATFCNNIANDLPITVNDPSVELELLYIDDLVDEMIAALQGKEHRCDFDGLTVIPAPNSVDNTCDTRDTWRYCYVPTTHKATLGEIVDLLKQFAEQPKTLTIPEIPNGSFAKKLYSTYLSYLPKEKVAFPLKMNVDQRGSFTELVHALNCGQVSINISKPGITKGQHWHHTKWEFFVVVSGHGLIQERNLNDPEGKVIEFEVTGDNIQCIHMLPGYTHNIINLSDTENLVTVMYCNEVFDPAHPDTFFDPV